MRQDRALDVYVMDRDEITGSKRVIIGKASIDRTRYNLAFKIELVANPVDGELFIDIPEELEDKWSL